MSVLPKAGCAVNPCAGAVFQWTLLVYPVLTWENCSKLFEHSKFLEHFYESGPVSLCASFFPFPCKVLLFHRNSGFAWGFVIVVSDVI